MGSCLSQHSATVVPVTITRAWPANPSSPASSSESLQRDDGQSINNSPEEARGTVVKLTAENTALKNKLAAVESDSAAKLKEMQSQLASLMTDKEKFAHELETLHSTTAGVVQEVESRLAAERAALTQELETLKMSSLAQLVEAETRLAALNTEKEALAKTVEVQHGDTTAKLEILQSRITELMREKSYVEINREQQVQDSCTTTCEDVDHNSVASVHAALNEDSERDSDASLISPILRPVDVQSPEQESSHSISVLSSTKTSPTHRSSSPDSNELASQSYGDRDDIEDSEGDSAVFPLQCIHINPSVPPNFFPSHHESEIEIQCRNTATQLKPRNSEATVRDEVQQLLAQWKESGQLSVIENHVLSIPSSQTSSIQQLSDALVVPHAKYIRQLKGNQLHLEVAKAYAIYCWITTNITYDEKFSKIEPELVLQDRKSVCSGYSHLYREVAVQIGLQVTAVHGNAKEWRIFSDIPDAQFVPSIQNSHCWNAVKLRGIWFPIDCTFGSGPVNSGNTNFSPKFNRHYFAVPPERLVLTHWPLDSSWQLLESPVTLKQMQPLIPVHAQVFGLGIQPKNWSECIHSFDSPVVRIQLKAGPGMKITAELAEYAIAKTGIQKPDFSAPEIEQAICVKCTENSIAINAAIPHSGCFSLNVYMKQPFSEGQQDPENQLCLSYQIRSEFSHQTQVGYPLVYDAASSAFGFHLLHWNLPQKSYIQENEVGKLEIAFRAKPDLQFDHCLLPSKVKDFSSSTTYQYQTMIARDSEDPTLYALQIVLPEIGWWTVNLCASKADVGLTGRVSYTAILNYHVLAKRPLQKHSYPHPLSRNITFKSCGPIYASGCKPLNLPFISEKALEFLCYLTYNCPQGERVNLCTNMIALSSPQGVAVSNQRYALKVIFPKPGKWYVHVYTKHESSETATYYGLFDLCLEVDGGMTNTIFPYLNPSLAKELSITFNTNDPIVFLDDATPFQMQFLGPTDLDAIHNIELLSATQDRVSKDTSTSEQHHTALLCDSSSNSHHCKYTLKAVFPYAGKWSVRLFSSSVSGADKKKLLIRADVEVSNPTPGVAYLKLHPAFKQLGLSVPDDHLQYNVACDSPDFRLPFTAPDNLYFEWTMKHVLSGEELNQQAFVHYAIADQNPSAHRLDLVLSRPGKWQLCFFAIPITIQQRNEIEVNEENQNCSLTLVLDFQIQTKNVITDCVFPQIFEPFRSFGIRMEMPSTLPLPSTINQIPGSVTIPFWSPPHVTFWLHAKVAGQPDSKHYDTQIVSNPDTGIHKLAVEITEQGHWTITLYAQHIGSSSQNWAAVLRHIIFADLDI